MQLLWLKRLRVAEADVHGEVFEPPPSFVDRKRVPRRK